MKPRPLYMSAITDAIVKGDVAEMKKLQKVAEDHVREHGDVATLLEHLKVEIAKAGKGGK